MMQSKPSTNRKKRRVFPTGQQNPRTFDPARRLGPRLRYRSQLRRILFSERQFKHPTPRCHDQVEMNPPITTTFMESLRVQMGPRHGRCHKLGAGNRSSRYRKAMRFAALSGGSDRFGCVGGDGRRSTAFSGCRSGIRHLHPAAGCVSNEIRRCRSLLDAVEPTVFNAPCGTRVSGDVWIMHSRAEKLADRFL
jgi:hypothetical protein